MPRLVLLVLLSLPASTTFAAGVETTGDVSFAVPDGWTFKSGIGFGAVIFTSGQAYWTMSVHRPMPSSGDTARDLNTAWTQLILPNKDYRGLPAQPYYEIRGALGYPGIRAEDPSVSRAALTRMYILETGKSFIPVVLISPNRIVMDAMEHVALAFIGSIRQAPLQAQALQYSITVADLTGHWKSGAATSRDFYNSQTGRYEGNATSFYGAGYTIANDGGFTYQMTGKSNGSTVREQESGIVQLGGEFVVFKGRQRVIRYRFINFQHSLDGATVLTLLPENSEVNASNIINYGQRWTREK